MKKFSIGEALGFGWSTMKANFWLFVGLLLTVIAVRVVLPGFFGGFEEHPQFSLARLAVAVVATAASIILQIGLTKITIMFVDGQKPAYREIYSHSNLFWRFLGTQILSGLIIMLGFILLIVPGIIWAIKYGFASYFVVDKGMGPIEALKHSGRITAGVKWQLWLFWIVLGLVNILGALALGIGLLATVPATMLAAAFVYRKLANSLEPAVVETTAAQTSA